MRRHLIAHALSLSFSRLAVITSLILAAATTPTFLVVCSTEAQAQTEVTGPLAPGKGELVVIGKVLAVLAEEKRLVISVTQVINSEGSTIDLRPPVGKSIVLSPTTSYRFMADANQNVTLSNIKPNTKIRAVGITKGSGSPLAARSIAIEADDNVDHQALSQTMPHTQKSSWWILRVKEPAEAHTFAEDGAYKITVSVPGAMPSSVQVIQGGLKMQNGQRWHLHFRAKSSAARRAKLSAIVGSDDFHSIGLREEISLEPEWHEYDYTFTVSKATEDGKIQCPAIGIGDKAGIVWLSGLVLEEAKEEKKSVPDKGLPK